MVEVTDNNSPKKQRAQRSIYDFTQAHIVKTEDSLIDDTRCEQVKQENDTNNSNFAFGAAETVKVKMEPVVKDATETSGDNIKVKREVNMETLDIDSSVLFQQLTTPQEHQENTSKSSISHESRVLCPVCELDISSLDIREKTDHVDTCLVRVTYVDEKPSTIIATTSTQTHNKNSTSPDKRVSSITSNGKKRKVEKEKIRYINTETNTEKKPKIIKPPTAPATPSPSTSRRSEISVLKTMTFPIDKKSQSKYQVSVDAFSFAPHAVIDKYFLTHFHADHYGGISKKWAYERVFKNDTDYEDDSKYKRTIYCTEITGKLLTLYFSIDPRFIKHMAMDTRYKVKDYGPVDVSDGGGVSDACSPGLYVTPITANHCPGAGIFLFESIGLDGNVHRILHCGDFRVNMTILDHPLLKPFSVASQKVEESLKIDKVYLDTTYMNPTYNFPKQELVCDTVAELFDHLTTQEDNNPSNSLFNTWFGMSTQRRITDFWKFQSTTPTTITTTTTITKKKKKFLILVGTYVIGKERLAIAISKRLQCPIYASNINNRKNKYDILKIYEDEYLDSVLTDDEIGENSESDCVVHLVPMNIVGSIQELSNYFNHNRYYESFERCVGLRPTGWSFAQNGGKQDSTEPRETEPSESIQPTSLQAVADLMRHKTTYTYTDNILSQAPKNKGKHKPDQELYRIYSLPYSEHSSFRELAYFVVFFNIGQVVPTVNCHNVFNLKRMESIIATWEQLRRIKTGHLIDTDKHVIAPELVEQVQNLSLDSF
ncbi:pso2 [Candida theae]|uniref:Pso2 n=1 Tax=Candida theae TaxID=1198502 RepID=A0AAD5BIT7_9ASCO|nr:pso2 [Candida theae]KAI5967080.1 pso2 [Candida theae]